MNLITLEVLDFIYNGMLIGLKLEEPPTALRNILLRMQLNAI